MRKQYILRSKHTAYDIIFCQSVGCISRNVDIDVYILEPDYVRELLQNNQILQALMAAPLWKYFYDKDV